MDKGVANVDTNEFLTGEILAHSPNFLHVEVRLANGEEIKAVISKSIGANLAVFLETWLAGSLCCSCKAAKDAPDHRTAKAHHLTSNGRIRSGRSIAPFIPERLGFTLDAAW